VVVAALAAAGCGRSDEPDLVSGKELFVEKCQRCHVLERAGGGADVGPNLDEAFGPARGHGLGEDTVAGVVERQIANVRRNSEMPANLVEGEDARAVAAYVAAVAGRPGKDAGALAEAGAKVSNKPIAAKGGKLDMPADPSGALAFASTKATAPPGSIRFEMPNESSVQHNIALQDKGGKSLGVGDVVGQGGVSSFTASLKPGSFVYLCTVPGHAEGGMRGDLTVK
jgi:mono/diheme cytochrome c family protein